MSIQRVLVANRGEIALRVVRACHALGIEAVVAVSDADRGSLAARLADRSVCVGGPRVAQSYLNQDALLAAALGTGCDAVHPGYGFLAENPSFPAACEGHGLTFVGPRSETISSMGNKLAAREIATGAGVPIVPGSPHIARFEDATAAAEEIGFPLLIKAAAGGGGRGIRVVREPDQLRASFEGASAEAEGAFGDGAVYIERYVERARHVEVQVIADHHGNVVHLGDRDCSMQRRYQKIIEEAPATSVPTSISDELRRSAVALAGGIGYTNAGTVEFIYDIDRQEYYFLEMNTRIQVEHPVTEEVTGVDLVQLQLKVAGGEPLGFSQEDVVFSGHAIECRITAEAAEHGFRPSPGEIRGWGPPVGEGIRLDSHVESGYVVPPFYDSLLGKLIVSGVDRDSAITRMVAALRRFQVEGVDTTLPFLTNLVDHKSFRAGEFDTRWVEEHIDELLG
jgi:acetyl-CoA carboxylase, biotin carboxylase subunit